MHLRETKICVILYYIMLSMVTHSCKMRMSECACNICIKRPCRQPLKHFHEWPNSDFHNTTQWPQQYGVKKSLKKHQSLT